MSSWSWTKASLLSWERFFRKIFKKPSNKPVKLKKHKMIARAFERRKDINNGRLSISFGSTHDDPLGMKFDLNSVSSHEMSSTFANAMPKLVRRRGGMFAPTAGTNRRYSDSDIGSVASKMASRRQSLDSQLSEAQGQFQQSEEEDADQEYVDLPNMIGGGGGAGTKRRRKRKKKRKSRKSRVQPILAPVTREMAARAYGGRRRGKRRSSKSSLGSRASAQGVDINVEKNSMEAVSITSYSHQGSLDNATLPIPPQSLTTNFAIFTASAYAGELKANLNDSSGNGNMRSNSNRREEHKSRRTRNDSTSLPRGRKRLHSTSANSRQGSASNLRHRDAPLEISNSRQGSGSSVQPRNAALEASNYHRQGSASSSRQRDVALEMRETALNRKPNSATSRSSRGTRQSSATSNRSNISLSRQLPGETAVVQIEDDYISEGSLD